MRRVIVRLGNQSDEALRRREHALCLGIVPSPGPDSGSTEVEVLHAALNLILRELWLANQHGRYLRVRGETTLVQPFVAGALRLLERRTCWSLNNCYWRFQQAGLVT